MAFFSLFGKRSQSRVADQKGWTPSEGVKYALSSLSFYMPRLTIEGAERKMSKAGYDITPLTTKEREQCIAKLSPMQQYVAVDSGTERSFTGKTANGYPYSTKLKGIYASVIGELPVFSSDTKFDSGTGWPSFYAPIDSEHIIEVMDFVMPFMPRVEVIDARGGAHLGHVFNDGPLPTKKRYCLNAAALIFIPAEDGR